MLDQNLSGGGVADKTVEWTNYPKWGAQYLMRET
jgi:hypothetical protein